MGGVVADWLNGFETEYDFSPVQALFDSATACRKQLESAIAHIKEKKDSALQEFHAARLVSMATDTIIAHLLTRDATFAERKQKVAKVFLVEALPRIKANLAYIESGETSVLEFQNDIIL